MSHAEKPVSAVTSADASISAPSHRVSALCRKVKNLITSRAEQQKKNLMEELYYEVTRYGYVEPRTIEQVKSNFDNLERLLALTDKLQLTIWEQIICENKIENRDSLI